MVGAAAITTTTATASSPTAIPIRRRPRRRRITPSYARDWRCRMRIRTGASPCRICVPEGTVISSSNSNSSNNNNNNEYRTERVANRPSVVARRPNRQCSRPTAIPTANQRKRDRPPPDRRRRPPPRPRRRPSRPSDPPPHPSTRGRNPPRRPSRCAGRRTPPTGSSRRANRPFFPWRAWTVSCVGVVVGRAAEAMMMVATREGRRSRAVSCGGGRVFARRSDWIVRRFCSLSILLCHGATFKFI
mmetsp:Transcript_30399/g.63552  ORF Transcript_30399/g.63552 Transcript_30399/m.63552 type:complete len:245 (+) Transcript_30399:183-917(+)